MMSCFRQVPDAQRRKSQRHADLSREQILVAATNDFARLGLDGARVDSIAAQAGLSVRMLYYYFSSKDGLFLAVLERVYGIIRESEQSLDLDLLEPTDAIRRLVESTWQFQLDHPEFITLVNSENLHQGRHLAVSGLMAEAHSTLLEMISRILQRGGDAGVFRLNVDPMRLYITIASQGYFYLSNRYTLSAIFGKDLAAQDQRTAHLAHMIEVVLGYLRPEVDLK